MNEEQLQLLWDLNAKDAGFTDYNEFKTLMGDSTARKTYFDATNSQLGFTDYSEFESLLGLGGEQEVSAQGSAGTSQTSGQPSGSSVEPSSEDNFQPTYTAQQLTPEIPNISASGFGSSISGESSFGNIVGAANDRMDSQIRMRQQIAQRLSEETPYLVDNPLANAAPAPFTPEAREEFIQQRVIPIAEETNKFVDIINYQSQATESEETPNILEQLSTVDKNLLTDEAKLAYDIMATTESIKGMNLLPPRETGAQMKSRQATERGLELGAADTDRWWTTKYVATPIANIGSAVGREGTRLVSGILGIPEYANDVVVGAMNAGIGLIGGDPETIPTWKETYGETPIDQIRSYLNEAVDRNIAKNSARYGDNDIWDTLKAGNIDAAANKLADGLGGMLPFMTLLATTGGAGLMAGTGALAADQYESLQDTDAQGLSTQVEGVESQDMPGHLKLLNSTINGIAETGLEAIGNKFLLAPLESAVKNLGRKQGQELVQSTLEKTLRKYVGAFYPLAPPAIETITEVATTLTDNVVAKATGEDPNRKINQGFTDTIILSLAMSGGTQTATSTLNGISNKKNVNDARKILQENTDIEEAIASGELTGVEVEALNDKYTNNIQRVNDYVINDLNRRDKLSASQKEVVANLEAMKSRQSALIESENIPDSVKESAQANVDEINNNIEDIIVEAGDSAQMDGEIREQAEETEAQQEQIVEETEATEPGQIFTRDIGGEQTVYRRNEDGTASIVPDAEAQQILNQPTETPVQESVQVEEVTDGVQQSEAFMNPEQPEPVNTTLEEIGFTPEESTSFFEGIQTQEGRSALKQERADRIRQYWQSQQNLGIAGRQPSRQQAREDLRFLRDLTEYAVLSLTDGTIQTLDGFRELARGLGVATEDVVNRAFYAARDIVNDYAATNPDRVSVQERAGNLIVQIQEGQQVPPATTKVTSGTVRKITDGGVQGKVTLTNRQALKTQIQTLNRGIREGRKQITESRKEITDFIKGMKEAGLFRGKVRGSTVNALINRVNKANTPAQLRNALDYAEKASRIIDYDQKLSTANTLKSRAKSLAKRKGIPADLVPVLKGMGGINPRYIDNIEAFNEQLAELISAVDGAGIDGIEQTQHRDLITSVKNKIEQARIQALKDQLIDAGMGSDFVDALNTMNQLLEAVASIPDESKPSGESKREFRERIYEQTKELLGELDRTELSPQQSVALDALLGIDVSQVSDQMMAAIAVVGKNAAVNQSFAGAGPIIAEYRLQQETSNQKNVDKVKSTVRIASRIGKATRERFGTVIAQIDAVMRDQQAASAFYALTGFGDILEGSTRYGHRADGVKKIVEDLSKKHAKDLSDSVQSAMYAMYADLNQYKNTWTEEQRVEDFNKRKEAIQTSIDRIEEQMGRDKHFEVQQRDYLSNVKKAWEQVKSAKHPDEIYDKLNNGFKAAYSEMRGFYDSILPEMQDNALIHNNTDLDTDWVNYFPRSYKKLGRPATERKIEQIEEMAGSMGIPLDDIVNQGESSGAKQNRVITGAQLPANATINFDAFNSFYDSSLRALYDIETQPARQYAARALNSGRVAEIFGDATPLEIFRNATIQKIGNDQLGLYGGTTGWFRSALRGMSTWGTRLALGGVGQVVKQSIPQMSDTVIRLGNNAHLLAVGLNGYLKYNDLLNEAIKDQPVSRRNVATVERQTSVINKRELNEIRKGLSTGVLRGLRIADEVVEAISLSSLKWGDDMAAKASWLAFYLEYKKRNGETVVDLASELQNPNKDAKAYATQRVELTNNVSDPSLRANTSKHIAGELLAVIAPFSSFAINAKLELATSLSRLRELGGMNNQERLRTVRNVGGNVANILVYNVIGKTIRNIMIGGTASLAYALLNNDDWDEDDEKAARELIDTWESDAIARNEENSTEYLVNDLIFGGIAERSLQPGIDVIKDLYAKAKGEQPKERFARPRTIYDALGIFGIPARTAGRFFNDLSEWTMTDAEWQMRKFSIEDAWGETRYVPLEYRGINRPIFSRKGFGLTTLAHGVALTGASSQEVSALANRLPGLISQIETKLHGKDRKDKLVENESLRKIRVAGQTKELTEEQWKWTVNERRKFLEEVETSDRFVTLQKNELASKVGDELSEKIRRETATKYARAKAIIEFNLVEGVGEKIAKDAKKKASDIISAADLWKKQLNPNTYPKQEQ